MTSYGAIASQEWTETAPPEGSAYVEVDFTAPSYKVNGSTVTISTIFDSTVDLADINASGLAPWEANATRAKLSSAIVAGIYAFLDTGITFVFEIGWDGSSTDSGPLFILGDGADPDDAEWLLYADAAQNTIAGSRIDVYDYDSLAVSAALTPVNTGIVRYAFTIGRPDTGVFKNEAAFNGSTFVDMGDSAYDAKVNFPSLDFTEVFGSETWSWFFAGAYIRKFQIYEAVSPTDLLIASAAGLPLTIAGTPVTIGSTVLGGVYDGFSVSASGGVPPYSYSVGSGSLPTGLTIDSATGAVSGAPSAVGSYTGIVLRVTDDNGDTDDLASFDIVITPQWAILTDFATISSITNGSPASFGTLNIGPADADRVLALVVTGENGNNWSITAGSVGGNATTSIVAQTSQIAIAGIHTLALAAGTSAAITFTFSGTMNQPDAAISVIAMYGVVATANDTDLDHHYPSIVTSWTDSVNQVADGITIGTVCYQITAAPGGEAVDWTNLTEANDRDAAVFSHHSTAFSLDSSTTSRSITVTMANTGYPSFGVMALATFGPS